MRGRIRKERQDVGTDCRKVRWLDLGDTTRALNEGVQVEFKAVVTNPPQIFEERTGEKVSRITGESGMFGACATPRKRVRRKRRRREARANSREERVSDGEEGTQVSQKREEE